MNVSIGTRFGPLRGQVRVSRGPMRLADLASTAAEITDVVVSRARAAEEHAGRSITCCAGCGACCRQLVPISPPEALRIADVIEALPPDRRAEVLARYDAVTDLLGPSGFMDEILDADLMANESIGLAYRYFKLGAPCPFLVDESCSIHTTRPVACREYNVTSPAVHCQDPGCGKIETVSMPFPLSLALSRLTSKLTGAKPILIPLSLVPYWLARNLDLAQRTWPGEELFRAFMETAAERPGERRIPTEDGGERIERFE
jgi:Fe-S-cluster containining protein